jgi:IS30 family transposase
MNQGSRPKFLSHQKEELWRRWRSGQSISETGRAVGKVPGSVFGVLRVRGVIAPAARLRSTWSLSLADREEISRGLLAGLSMRRIAQHLDKSTSTISREIARNRGLQKYRAADADERAWREGLRPKAFHLAVNKPLQKIVAQKLDAYWLPQQIAGWLRVEYLDTRAMRVSHETIYKSLFIQARGVPKKEVVSRLCSKRLMRRGKSSTTRGQPRGQIIDAI